MPVYTANLTAIDNDDLLAGVDDETATELDGSRVWDPPALAGDLEDAVFLMRLSPGGNHAVVLVLADDPLDVERRVIATYGMDAVVDSIVPLIPDAAYASASQPLT